MHLPRRVAFGEVERGEVVVVGLDVRPFGDGKPHIGEDGGDLVHHLADRVNASDRKRVGPGRQCDVDGFGGQPGVEGRALQRFAAK